MRGQLRIDTVFAFIVLDDDGTEGIPGAQRGSWLVPLTGADVAKAEQFMPTAMMIAAQANKSIELVHFGERKHVGWIDPPGGPQRPPEAPEPEAAPFVGPHVSVPYTNFPVPEFAPENVVHAEGVWVAGTLVDGQPGIAVSYLVDGEWQPPLVVVGRVAEDLAILTSDGLTAVRRTQN